MAQGWKAQRVISISVVSRLEFEFRFNSLMILAPSQVSCFPLCKMGILVPTPQAAVEY